MKTLVGFTVALLLASLSFCAVAETSIVRDFPPGLQIPAAAQPGPGFDVDKATAAWLGLLSPEQRRLSDDYFEGGYWLQLWEALYTIGVMLLLVATGLSRRMRDLAERISNRPLLNVAIYAALFIVAIFVLGLPMDVYSGFVREHQYGLSNLSFARWFGEALIGLAVSVVLAAPAATAVYAAVRRSGPLWWTWATGLTLVFWLFLAFITPLFIAPLFNDYKPLGAGPVRDAVLSLARANEIPTDHLEWFDASKQTTRISANVSGLWGAARINLNDNLLDKTSLPEIKAVLGHEMGHYVLNHAFKLSVYLTLVFGIAFVALHFTFDRTLVRWGSRWGLRDRADPAALPLAFAIFTLIWFVLTPLHNTAIREVEAEADAFGLNTAREPEGFAMAAMRLSTYRKLVPGPVEEFIFYDHPSGYERVHRAMLWRKENMTVEPIAPSAR
jgi:STE24 endopeptidase